MIQIWGSIWIIVRFPGTLNGRGRIRTKGTRVARVIYNFSLTKYSSRDERSVLGNSWGKKREKSATPVPDIARLRSFRALRGSRNASAVDVDGSVIRDGETTDDRRTRWERRASRRRARPTARRQRENNKKTRKKKRCFIEYIRRSRPRVSDFSTSYDFCVYPFS